MKDSETLRDEDIAVIIVVDEHDMQLTDDGTQYVLEMVLEAYPEFNGKVTAFLSGKTANEASVLASVLQDTQNAAIIVQTLNPEPCLTLVDREMYNEITQFLLDADHDETSWSIMANVIGKNNRR